MVIPIFISFGFLSRFQVVDQKQASAAVTGLVHI